jgi:hypothetical protein
MAERAN